MGTSDLIAGTNLAIEWHSIQERADGLTLFYNKKHWPYAMGH